jgi:hypothetical protein
MKLFGIVIVVAAILGGFVGGELTGKLFSPTGLVIGGVVVAAGVLLLGAYFDSEDRKKGRTLSPEMRGLFDRLLGQQQTARPRTTWTPRPFFKNQSAADYREWFAHAEPWNRVDTRILDALIRRLAGSPMFEVFVHTARESNVIPQFVPLKGLFDRGVGDVALFPQIALIMFTAGQTSREITIRLLSQKRFDDPELAKHYNRTTNALDSALALEPNFLPAYLELALLNLVFGKKSEAKELCDRGLQTIQRLRKAPFEKSGLESIRTAAHDLDEIAQRLQSLRDEQLADA